MNSPWKNEDTCRICLRYNENLQCLQSYCDYYMIKEMIEINEKLEDRNILDKGCEDCLEELKIAHNFKVKCDSSNKILLDLCSSLEQKINENNETLDKEDCSLAVFDNKGDSHSNGEVVVDLQKTIIRDIEDDAILKKFETQHLDTLEKPISEIILEKKLTNELQKLAVSEDSSLKENIKLSKLGKKSCDVCNYTAPYPSALVRHLRIHSKERPFKCVKCQKTFSDNSTLNKHKSCHDGNPHFICHTCGKQFIFRTSLVKHLAIHKDEIFKCEVCSKNFNSKFNLETHFKRHTSDRNFVCELCGKKRVSKYNLDVHMRVHSGQQHFKCNECSYRTVSKSGLKIHERIHSGDRPFSCPDCGESFISGLQMTRHVMKMHRIKLKID